MPMTCRPFESDEDRARMIDLARRNSGEHLRLVDLPYRLSSWALDDPQNTCLWFDENGQLLAWAVLQTPFWTIDYAFVPGATHLHTAILAWADQRVMASLNGPYGHPCWFVNVFADQAERIQTLEAAGFASQADVGEDSWTKVFMLRQGALPVPDFRIPAGFVVRPLAMEDTHGGQGEVDLYVELHRAVFESKNMTAGWRRRSLGRPEHDPNLDLVVAAPDGRLAAFCVGWLCPVPGQAPIGQIEPLGCHKDFRRYALGRVVLAECLRRMQAMGIEQIYVETDNYRNTAMLLYKSLGFKVVRDVLVFRKDYGEV